MSLWWQLPESTSSMDWKNVPENSSFAAYFIHSNKRRRHKEGCMESIGSRWRWQEKVKERNLLDWIKNETKKHTSFTLVDAGELIINIYSTWRWYGGDKTKIRGSVVSISSLRLYPEGSSKKGLLTSQKFVKVSP